MQIKVFKYEVSNSSRSPLSEDERTKWYRAALDNLVTPEEIEYEINEFCCDKEIVDIKVSTVDVKYHNNASGNTIELWYTIMYKEG